MSQYHPIIDLSVDVTTVLKDSVEVERLPDLHEILAGLNKPCEDTDKNALDSEDVADFKQSIAQFNNTAAIRIPDVSVTKEPRNVKEKAPRKARTPKPKTPKPPKEPKAKRSKPMSITARAILPYAPPLEMSKPTKTIAEYMTPSHKNVATNKARSSAVLASPRTIRTRYGKQKLIYKDFDTVAKEEANDIGMSKLVTLTRQLWQKSNRDADGNLFEHEAEEVPVEPEQVDSLSPIDVPPAQADTRRQIVDLDLSPVGTQEYLEALVAGSDNEVENSFPVVPVNLIRDDTSETLRETLLEVTGVSDERPSTAKRRHESTAQRRVSQKTPAKTSPRSQALLIETSASDSDVPLKFVTTNSFRLSSRTRPTSSGPIIDLVNTTDVQSMPEPVECWIVPDSEDDATQRPRTHAPVDSQGSLPPHESTPTTAANTAPSVEAPALPPPPDYSSFTTVKLQTELGKYGFKPSKNRAGMINVLGKCWQATHSSARSMSTTDHAAGRNFSTTRKSAKRETKTEKAARLADERAAARLAGKEVIAEKAPPIISKEEREQARLLKKQENAARKLEEASARRMQRELEKQQSIVMKAEDELKAWQETTKILKSSDGKEWFDKILTYEPIILEDLIEFLARYKVTIDSESLTKYFDARAVCCVKKVTRQGKSRRRL